VTGDPVYVLDANVFIEAARRYYAFDVAPAFWNGLVHHAARGGIKSIDKIKQELERVSDDLADWIKKGNIIEQQKNHPPVTKDSLAEPGAGG